MANETHDINDIKRRMHGASAVLKTEMSGLRTGRASAHLLDPVMVEAYGAQMPLAQVGTVSVPEPRMISVNVWTARWSMRWKRRSSIPISVCRRRPRDNSFAFEFLSSM